VSRPRPIQTAVVVGSFVALLYLIELVNLGPPQEEVQMIIVFTRFTQILIAV